MVDPVSGQKTAVFDMDKLAMQLSEIVRDPYDAKHIPIANLKLKEDKYFTFSITSSREVPDTAKKSSAKVDKPLNEDPQAPQGKTASSPKMKKKVYHFKYDIASKTLTDVTAEEEKKADDKKFPRWASISPDGTKAVYSRNGNLFWMDSTSYHKAAKDEKDSTIVEHRLTSDGIKDFSFGSIGTDTTRRSSASVIWSPDSKHFATIKTDQREIKDFWVINSLSNPRPTLETYKYQMPGEPGATDHLYLFDLESGEQKYIKSQAFKDQDLSFQRKKTTAADSYKDYTPRIWMGDDNGFYVERVSRDLKRRDICWVDVASDSTKTIISERLNTYTESRDLVPIKGGKQLLWWSERNGWANLYLFNSDGTLVKNITEGPFHVEDILGVNEASGYVLFSACGVDKDENPYQMHNYKVSLNGGTPVQLDMKDMDVLATASDDAKFIVANYSRVDYRPAVALYNVLTGKKVMELEDADFSLLMAAGYKFPERFKVKAADGITDLYGAMYKPFDFDSTKVYPICDYVYPGPQVEANNISWSKGFTRVDRLAQLGFIVVTVGNRGGHPNRSKWYHNYGYGNLRDYGLEDQKYAVQQLAARYPFIDIDRVGIHGHSGGGFMSTAAILTYPDFFKVAVSCSGNHDNSVYNRWWSEQHHGVLEKIDQGDTTFVYHIETNQQLAKNLKGHLMLWTGDIDNNVHPAGTIRVMDALIRANKRFDFMMLPGQRHSYGDMNEYFFWGMADYYSQWLMGDSSHLGEIDIKELNND
ncbi:MAG: S9 family peptidase [Bacteroidales bacterium]|nr:S9 family peptidase [Bacteroidales bacterium]